MPSRRGVLVFMLLITLVGVAVLTVAIVLRWPPGAGGKGRLLVMDVPSELVEGDVPMRGLAFGASRRNSYFLHEVIEGLRQAADDDDVRGLVMHIDGLDWGWAKTYEVREAVQRFRDTGKPVYASLTGGGELEYLLATQSDLLSVPPTATVEVTGLSMSAMFLKGTLDKLDITANYVHAGQYKSAIEQYTRSDMSAPAREALKALLDDHYELLVDSVATARGLDSREVERLLDEGPYSADGAITAGLADTVLYDAEVDSLAIREMDGAKPLDFNDYLNELGEPRSGQHVALILAEGEIMPGKSRDVPGDEPEMGSETMIEALRQVRKRKAVKAVVLRIDSPGGSLEASDDIWREVKRLSDEKPVIVSMSDLAASGGYYIAAPAQKIVADPATITGSIGVFGGKLNILGLYRKLGINIETLSRGKHAEMMSQFRDFSPEERERFQREIDGNYRVFLGRVADGRGFTVDEVDSVAQGRVWSGERAWEVGLVDTLGGLSTALSIALDEAGIEDLDHAIVDVYPKVEHPWYERILDDLFSGENNPLPDIEVVPPVMRAWIRASRLPDGTAMALMPYSIVIR